jgi:hypothetical protein
MTVKAFDKGEHTRYVFFIFKGAFTEKKPRRSWNHQYIIVYKRCGAGLQGLPVCAIYAIVWHNSTDIGRI